MPKLNDDSGESYKDAAENRSTSQIDTFSNGTPHSRKGYSAGEIKSAEKD